MGGKIPQFARFGNWYPKKCHPKATSDHRFNDVKDVAVPFYTKDSQMSGGAIKTMTIGEALDQGILNNQTLGYFLGRIFLFAVKMGVDPARCRFRKQFLISSNIME